MRMLFVGGTRFVGRAIAEAALAAGHEVTLLHRGSTGADVLPEAEHLRADRNGDLEVLAGRTFDVTVDACAYVPRQVESLADALGERGGHHVLVSTMSVYAETARPGLTEDGAVVELPDPSVDTVTDETYGGLKVLCERAALSAYGPENLTVVRPTYVVGPDDYTLRFPRWVRRIAQGGEVLAPGPETAPVQLIDARDQGEWVVRLAESRTPGVFNGIGTGLPFGFGDMLGEIARAVAPPDTTLTWVDGSWLVEQGVDPALLPLWSAGQDEWTLAASNAKAVAAGLHPRPLAETVADTLAWIQQMPGQPEEAWGLGREQESALLAEWHGRSDA